MNRVNDPVSDNERKLRDLAMNEEAGISSLLGLRLGTHDVSNLDARTFSLIRLSAVVCLGAAPVTYQWATQAALSGGATDDEIIGVLVTIAPIVGVARIVEAVPEVAEALGYPVEAALETMGTALDFPRPV